MASLADRTIDVLLDHHDALADIVADLSDVQLTAPSGASEWTVAQVLSHLGSGAELALAGYRASLGAEPDAGPDFSQTVWDRWDAMRPEEQAREFVTFDERLVESLDDLTAEQRAGLMVKLPYLPAPRPFVTTAGMRLNEVALHSWDVRVALDPSAALDDEAADVLAAQLSTELDFILGYVGKPDALGRPAVVDAGSYGLVIADKVSMTTSPQDVTASFEGPLESLIRLIGGRLTDAHTPDTVRVSGEVTLDDLRRVFPGF
ncbi:MAG TPA: maleylpyruvate isomerase family mycothiol-dependent enzyme [Mycobacteriales bacterium]|nr:maleylpyruvate isomerase family mycothiol-dependent enzyme [Mycobacteriales bacterium]